MKPITVLSLFDGVSALQIALERMGVPVAKYYASEIDPYAVKVTQHHFPKTIQLGDVKKLRLYLCAAQANLDKMKVCPYVSKRTLWLIGMVEDIRANPPMICCGGSPCQGFSFAGKQLAFDDPRSVLFFEFVKIKNYLQKINPKIYFLLENVKMAKVHELVMAKSLGVKPLRFNSALVSAQNRQRLYFTNIPVNTVPKDRGILLRDILEDGAEQVLRWQNKQSGAVIESNKGATLRASGGTDIRKRMQVIQINPATESGGKQPYMQNRVYDADGKSCAVTQLSRSINVIRLSGDRQGKDRIYSPDAKSPALLSQMSSQSHHIGVLFNTNPSGHGQNGNVFGVDGKAPAVTTNKGEGSKIIAVAQRGRYNKDGIIEQQFEVGGEKSNTITSVSKDSLVNDGYQIRKLTVNECCALQTFERGWFEGVISNSRAYHALGNSFTIEIIVHILSHMPEYKNHQL